MLNEALDNAFIQRIVFLIFNFQKLNISLNVYYAWYFNEQQLQQLMTFDADKITKVEVDLSCVTSLRTASSLYLDLRIVNVTPPSYVSNSLAAQTVLLQILKSSIQILHQIPRSKSVIKYCLNTKYRTLCIYILAK